MCANTLIVIQCRFNSRRLSGKALMPLAGTSMLGFLIRRLQWGLKETGWNIMLATTWRQDDAEHVNENETPLAIKLL